MNHSVNLTDRQLELVRDLLQERLEDVEADLAHFEENPEALNEDLEPGDEPLQIDDYEAYRDEIQTLLDNMPEPAATV
ncbi:MAG: hypothetical protein VKP62_13415 [Candidatus Sericytochromatia bacterium]|nr:hypothetical protein [Candidatus Sericytochromatia bacterium]